MLKDEYQLYKAGAETLALLTAIGHSDGYCLTFQDDDERFPFCSRIESVLVCNGLGNVLITF